MSRPPARRLTVGCEGDNTINQATHTYTKDRGISTTINFCNVGIETDFSPALSAQEVARSAGIDLDALRPVTTPAGSAGIGGA